MTDRETRVIGAFKECVKNGTFTPSYAITQLENEKGFGYLSEDAKEDFYAFLETWETEKAALAAEQAAKTSVQGVSHERAVTGVVHEDDTDEEETEEEESEAEDPESDPEDDPASDPAEEDSAEEEETEND